MPRVWIVLASVVLGVTLLGGCIQTGSSPSASPGPSASHPSPLASSRPGQGEFSTAAKGGGAMVTPASLLTVIRVAEQPGFDRIVFEFDGLAPAYDVSYVDRVHRDPSGTVVALDGDVFLLVRMPGATLNTASQESNPADARSYSGPQRIHPDLRRVKELVVAGDFEAVLSFGVGIDHRAPFRVLRLADPSRIAVDIKTP